MLIRSVRSLCSNRGCDKVGVRSIFWWGHDTEEDKQEREALEKSKGLISWTDPKKDLEKKKEYVWAPARIEQEAMMATGVTTGMMNHVDFLKWSETKLTKAPWHTWMTDPMRWKEDMKKKHMKHLVLSQVFLRERLQALGPDLAAAHFLCYRNCRVRSVQTKQCWISWVLRIIDESDRVR